MIVTIYYKDKPAYVFTTTEENFEIIIQMLEEKYNDKIGFKIEKEKKKVKV